MKASLQTYKNRHIEWGHKWNTGKGALDIFENLHDP
jgi:hypothetical protein